MKSTIKHALKHKEALKKLFQSKQIAIFLDYDGTLTPIVARPELATLNQGMRHCLERLSKRYPTAIISGRALSNLKSLVGLENIYYAGNHGFEIEGPEDKLISYTIGHAFFDDIELAHQKLTKELHAIKGLLIEHKKFSLSIHYRLVDTALIPKIETTVDNIVSQCTNLKKHYGKKVFEIRPEIAWNKGKAIIWLLQALKLTNNHLSLYIGDDVTDEDAFKVLKTHGVGILVSINPQKTAANYYLNNTKEVREFLEWMAGF